MNLCLAKCYPSFKPQLDITSFILLLFGDAVLPSSEASGLRSKTPGSATCWLCYLQHFPLTSDFQIVIYTKGET